MNTLVQDAVIDDAEQMRHRVCEYLESISEELCTLAYDHGFDSLAIIFELARADAKRILRSSDKHVERS